MLVFFQDQRFEGALHRLISVEAKHNNGMTLYAPSQDEEARIHKKQGHGATYNGKC
jgi:hypothetical protein